jgi:hypothetical protein
VVRPALLRSHHAGEINRIATNEFSQYVFLHSEEGAENLPVEAIAEQHWSRPTYRVKIGVF